MVGVDGVPVGGVETGRFAKRANTVRWFWPQIRVRGVRSYRTCGYGYVGFGDRAFHETPLHGPVRRHRVVDGVPKGWDAMPMADGVGRDRTVHEPPLHGLAATPRG